MAEVNMEQLLNCALCPNMCRFECPVLQILRREAVAPAGKARFAYQLQKGYLSWSEDLLETISSCLGCRGCQAYCPFPELNLCDELLKSRAGAGASGARLSNCEPYLSNLKKYSSPYGQKNNVEPTAKKAKVLYYAGCTALANQKQSVQAACELLEKAGRMWAGPG